ncbi:membrane protein [Leptolyngbya sp. BL0902]|uniref:DUF2157 domain-containing protein n=1 Tax=Leptolyngbya sp. BL0902 TaxID=1115757 RepID=UPI0018E7811C|nr:DUF2157 domain-containing protein [Leptolyngbya sp. BL0902]QQE65997.1 membrane protein [Leptolyngbya sp. BL0902]
MMPERFRRQLRQEAETWQAEGLIDAELYETLAHRYQFTGLEQAASNRFIAILMGLGAVLLGLGAITFVAANWQVWPRAVRVALLLSTFLWVNSLGFYWWRQPAELSRWHRLGHGLLLLGALLLGANLGLMSQMFHQSGDLFELLLVWGLGVAAMAYSLRLTSLSMFALLLVGLGYAFSWGRSSIWQEWSTTALLIQHMPLVVAAVFVPLAYWCRSRVLLGFSGLMVALSLMTNSQLYWIWHQGWLMAVALVLPPALLWSYSDRIWQRTTDPDWFDPVLRQVALWFLSVLFYLLSFHYWWQYPPPPSDRLATLWAWPPLLDAALLGVVTGLGWAQLRYEILSRRGRTQAINSAVVALLLLVTVTLLVGQGRLGVLTALGFNILLFTLALGLVRDGLTLTQRSTFWGGMVLLVLGIVSRSLEYNTGLIFKSIVLGACGVGIIVAGLWFERRQPPPAALPESSEV